MLGIEAPHAKYLLMYLPANLIFGLRLTFMYKYILCMERY